MDFEVHFEDDHRLIQPNCIRYAPTFIKRCVQAQTVRSCLVFLRNGPEGSGEPFHSATQDPGAYSRPVRAANYSFELTSQPAMLVSDSVK